MPFLKLNGITFLVAEPGPADIDREEVGSERSRAEDGSMRVTRLGLKRSWRLSTPPMIPTDAIPFADLLWGLGYRWTFDADEFDAKGNGHNQIGTMVRTIRTTEKSTKQGVLAANPKFGPGCLEVDIGTTNILSQNVRRGAFTDLTGFTGLIGATISRNTSVFWAGDATAPQTSLHVDTPATTGAGVKTVAVAATAATEYAASVYIKATSGTPSAKVYLRDETGTPGASSGAAVTTALVSDTWTRFEVKHTTGGGSPTLSLYVETPTNTALVCDCDGFQIEARPGGWATSWYDGTRANGLLSYRLGELQKATDFTFMCWTRGSPVPAVSQGGQFTLALIGLQSNQLAAFAQLQSTDTNSLRLRLQAVGGSLQSLTKATPWDGAWHHVAMVVRRSGGNRMELFFDGASAALATPIDADMPDLSSNDLYIGTDGTDFWNGLIDDAVAVPFAMPASWISTIYTAGLYPASPPKLAASGDAFRGAETVNCYAGDVREALHSFRSGATWYDNGRLLTFRLNEI